MTLYLTDKNFVSAIFGLSVANHPIADPHPAGSELKPDCSSGLGIKKKKKIDFVVRFLQTAKNGV